EFLRRLEAYTGLDSVPRILKGVPLAFALDLPTSLTRQSVTQALTKFHGVRRNYHDASAYYRAHAAEQNRWRLSADEGRRAFPAPRMMLPERPPAIKCDLMVIMDFRLGGGAFVSTMNYVRSALAGGKTVSVYHYRRYDLDVLAPPSDELLALAHDEKVYWVSPGEEVIADTVLAGYPVVLAYPTDLAPKITCQRFGIITNQMHARLRSGGDVQYDPQVVSQNVRAMFGLKPV